MPQEALSQLITKKTLTAELLQGGKDLTRDAELPVTVSVRAQVGRQGRRGGSRTHPALSSHGPRPLFRPPPALAASVSHPSVESWLDSPAGKEPAWGTIAPLLAPLTTSTCTHLGGG